jgi:type IV secretion system protein TrbL
MAQSTGIGAAAESGRRWALLAGAAAGPARAELGGGAHDAPEWARRLRSEQSARHYRHVALDALGRGNSGGAGANPDIKERED